MIKFIYVTIIALVSSLAVAGEFNVNIKKTEISEGIYKIVKTYQTGEVKETILMEINEGIVSGLFEVEVVDGEYTLTEEGNVNMERAKAGLGSKAGSGGSSDGSGGSGGGC